MFATLLLFLISGGRAAAQASVTTDQPDYPPGSTVSIAGSGFQSGETVQLQVVNLTYPDDTGSEHQPWTVSADENGNFTATWFVTEDEAGMTLQLTATGLSSGRSAQVTFTDGSVTGLTVGSQSGTLTYGTTNSVTFTISFSSSGNGSYSDLHATGLPAGATASFSATSGSGNPPGNQTMTITSATNTPAGSFTITVIGTNSTPQAFSNTGTLTVNKRSIAITNVTAAGKAYDGTTAATLSGGVVSNRVNGDAIIFTNGTGIFASKYIGTWAVTASGFVLASNGVSTNYVLSAQPTVASASITARLVTITNVTAANKIYDGATTATLSGGAVSNNVSGDFVTFTAGTGSFASQYVGTKAVTASGYALTASGISTNYSLSAQPLVPNASISTRSVTITNVTAANKTYDGTTNATLSGGAVSNTVSGDSVTFTAGTGAFSSANVGTWAVTASGYALTTSGVSTNYSLSAQPTVPNATIVPGPANTLTVSGYPSPRVAGNPGTLTVTAKDQFGNTATNYTGTVQLTSSDSLATLAANHTFTASDAGTFQFNGNIFRTSGTQSFTATDVNTNSVTGTQTGIIIVGGTVSKLVFTTQPAGAVYKTAFTTQPVVETQDAYGNNSTNGLPANLIVSLALTAGAGPLAGTTNLNIGMAGGAGTATFSGLQINKAENGDVLTASASGYTSTNSSSFNVGAATLTISAAGVNKTYDGTTNATVNLSDNKFSGDAVTENYTSAGFADKNVGTNKTVSVSGISISGTDSVNYSLASTTATTTANISSASLVVTANDTNRVYGAPNPAFTASYGGFVGGDGPGVLSGAPSLTCDANAASTVGGSPYTIVATNGTLSAANYGFSFVNGQLTITQASTTNIVTVSANPSPTGSNVTLIVTLSAVAPGAGTPTGNVQFIVDGSAYGVAAGLAGGMADFTTNSFSHGYHTVSAQYTGDPNFVGSTNSLSPNLLVNGSPSSAAHPMTTTENKAATFAASALAHLDTDPDADALTITSVSSVSTNNGTVSLVSGTITYLPATNYAGADSFTYILSDTFGATATNKVNVTVKAVNASVALSGITPMPDHTMKVFSSGLPGHTYYIQASTDLQNWTTIGTNNPFANGVILFIDSQAASYPGRYYRLVAP